MAECKKNCIHWPVCDLAYRLAVVDFDTMHEEYRIDLDNVEDVCKHFLPYPEKRTVYWISCSTGCSCCSDQNFDYGFYFNKEEAEAQAEAWRNGIHNPLASQYAKYGRYHVEEDEAEILSDGRMIVMGRIFEKDEWDYKHEIWWEGL
jgi:hypothetical protein